MAQGMARRLSLALVACATSAGCGGGGADPADSGSSQRLALDAATSNTPLRQERKALLADGVLDAHHWPATAPYSYFSDAVTALNPPAVTQAFVANASGILTGVSLNLCVTGTSADTVIQIRRGGSYFSPVVATAQVPRSSSPLWGSPQCPGLTDMAASGQAQVTFDLSAANLGVSAGEELNITLVKTDTTSASDHWFVDFNGDRSATHGNWLVTLQVEGSQVDLFGYRMRYKTYVSPPDVWAFSGFLAPFATWPQTTFIKAGAAVPLKFGFGQYKGLDIFRAEPVSVAANCDGSVPPGAAGEVLRSAGNTSLRYDAAGQQYSYLWKTEESWSNTCRQVVIALKDGSTHRANVQFTR